MDKYKKPEEKIKELGNLTQPICEYLRENYNPYCVVVIDSESVKITETVVCVPQKKNTHCGE